MLENPKVYEDTNPTNIRLKPHVKQWLLERSEKENRPMADIVNELCEREIDKKGE